MTTATTTTPKRKGGNASTIRRRYLLARHGETNFNKEGRIQGTSDESVLTPDGLSQAAALGAYVARRQAGDAPDDVVGPPSSSSAGGGAGIAPPITRTWCSPLTRCRQTYAAVSSGCCPHHPSSTTNVDDVGGRQQRHVPLPDPTIRHDLREIELHEWEGRLRHEIEIEDRENWYAFRRDPTSLRLGGGEFAPVSDCWERGVGNWRDIRSDAATAATGTASDDGDSSPSSGVGDDDPDVVDDDDAADADASGAVFIMCHGAMGNCMLLHALGMSIEAYGRSRDHEFGNCDCVEIEWRDCDEIATKWRRVHPGGGGGWRSTAAVVISPPSTSSRSLSRGEGATTAPPSDGGLPCSSSRSSPGEGISDFFAP